MKKQVKNYLTSFIFIILVLGISVGSVYSHTDSTQVISDPASGNLNFAALLFKTIVSLAIVIILLFGFVYGLKWLQSKTQTGYHKYNNMSVLDTLAIGPKKQLHLVQVLGRVILIGSSESSIELLLELDEKEKSELYTQKEKIKPFTKTLSEQISKFSGSVKH